jgi:hypothetical protein
MVCCNRVIASGAPLFPLATEGRLFFGLDMALSFVRLARRRRRRRRRWRVERRWFFLAKQTPKKSPIRGKRRGVWSGDLVILWFRRSHTMLQTERRHAQFEWVGGGAYAAHFP